jgi:hypothetical protein
VINGEITGDKKVYAFLGDLSERSIERVDREVGMQTLLISKLAQRKASGGVLKSHSGELAAAIQAGTSVQKQPTRITGIIGLAGASKKVSIYGASQEFGATIQAHVLQAKAGKTLRFQLNGKFTFAKKVNIPAVQIPEHSFLRAAMREQGEEALRAIASAAQPRGIF